ncbi:MAG: glycosyltransferase family 4 protein [Ignavibacteriae bacterium]|nr:glycosyltransferase family 4 protein [Ignavibacteriota bacterium]
MKRRILFIDEDQERNGSTVSMELMLRAFAAAGWETFVLTWKHEEWTRERLRASATVIDGRWGFLTTLTLSTHFMYTDRLMSRAGVKSAIKDVVKFLGGILLLRRMIRHVRPDLVYANEYSVIQSALAARLSRVPAVTHVRSQMVNERFWLRRWALRHIVRMSADAVVAITLTDARQFVPDPGPASGVHVIGEFIEDHSRRPGGGTPGAADLSGQGDGPMVLCLSGIRDVTGSKEFLEAAGRVLAQHPRVRFVLAGNDRVGGNTSAPAYREACRGLIADLARSGRFEYVGEVADTAGYIASAAVMIAPLMESHFSRPIVEAWRAGKPVVAFHGPHMDDLIRDGVDGLLVERGNTVALGDAILRVIADPDLAGCLGDAGRVKATASFDAERNLTSVIDLCASLVRCT